MAVAPTITLNNGVKIPAFGLGTYTSDDKNEILTAVRDAIDAGYRHFDTAWLYGTETQVGQAIREKIAEGVVKREDVYYVTKLWNTFHRPEHVERIFRESLANSGLDYIDLYLIHFPVAFTYNGDDQHWPKIADGVFDVDNTHDFIDTWRELEKLVRLGLVRSIGVSNFNSVQIDRLLKAAEIKPVINQVELSPAINQKELTKFCKERDIFLTAYSPLGRPDVANKTPAYIFDDKVQTIADKYKKSPAQIVLRFLFELGVIPIPKSVTKSRIIENISIFDFQLNADDHSLLESFQTGNRLVALSQGKTAVEFPFQIPF